MRITVEACAAFELERGGYGCVFFVNIDDDLRKCFHGEFPSSIHYVHLADYVPYKKAVPKTPTRPEQIAFYGCEPGDKVKCKAGDVRGPAWYEMRRTEQDIPRLEYLAKNVVSVVRMGRFFESIDEKCSRCAHATPCLTRGYEAKGEDLQNVKRSVAVVSDESDGFGEAF